MCKKLGVAALVVVAALFTLHKLDLLGYGKVFWNRIDSGAREKISPELKIERLEAEVAKLTPDMKKHRSVIASEMVEVGKLKKQIAESNANLDKRQAMLKDMKAELDKGSTIVSVDGQKIPREKVEASLTRQWQSYKQAKEAVKSQEDVLKTREENLEVAKTKLATIQAKQEEMQAKVESMKLELRKLRLAQAQNNVAIDYSQLSTVLKLYDEVNTQIEKEKTELSLQKAADTDTAVQEAMERKLKTDQALKEMDEFFGGTKVSVSKKE